MEQILGKSSEDFLPIPRKGGPGLTTIDRQSIDLSKKIPGWGSDLDPSVRPGVPMDKLPHLGVETLYPKIEQQIPRDKVHKSVEHAKLTPVFGNVCPPRGLSGVIRDYAYGFSEGKLLHWLLLVLADRIDVIEELFRDISKGEIPNLPKEMGFGAQLKYNKKGLIKTAAVTGLITVGVVLVLKARNNKHLIQD